VTRDPDRSYEQLDRADLERLGRVAVVDWEAMLGRCPHLEAWRDQTKVIGLAQGAAEHFVRSQRGIWDLDVIVCIINDPALPRLSRRQVVSWDWGPSKFGRCRHDPLEYSGRAVDVKLWVIPERGDPIESLVAWLRDRLTRHPDPIRWRDLAQEPVVLITPDLGRVIWDPGGVPLPSEKTGGHRRPHGLAPT
jgi:hypothetical protein